MGMHLHWLINARRPGEVRSYIHDHDEPQQSHFYVGDRPVALSKIRSLISWPRMVDGKRNSKLHLRYPERFERSDLGAGLLLVCGAEPMNVITSASGDVNCKRCARQIHSIESLADDVRDYQGRVDMAEVERLAAGTPLR